MSKFNIKTTTKTINKAGGFAYTFDVETELIHAVLTTFLDDKYYESGKERIQRLQDLISKNKPEFVAKLAVVARNEFNLRSVTTILIGELSKIHRGDDLVKRAVIACAVRVDDLTELVAYLGGKLPKQVKRGIRNALFKFNRYQLAKYKSEGKGVSLVDVFNLVHPKVQHANEEQKQAWSDLMKGDLKSFDTWEVELAGAKDDKERKEKLSELILSNKIGYMALLRNLNNVIKYGCNTEVIKHAASRLSDKEEVLKSKQLPFRFTTAFDNVVGNVQLSNAISEAMDIAVSNVPELKGKTLIALDSSGSMSGKPFNIGSIFGATLIKANPDASFILYDTQVKELPLSSRSPVMDLSNTMKAHNMGGGTNTALVFQYAFQKGGYDRIIIISDNESWASNAQHMYTQYKSHFPETYVYAIDIQGYGTHDITGNKVKHLTGWSDRLLDFIGETEKDIRQYVNSKTI